MVIEIVEVASHEHAAEVIGRGKRKLAQLNRGTSVEIQHPLRYGSPVFVLNGPESEVKTVRNRILDEAKNFEDIRQKKRIIVVERGDIVDNALLTHENSIAFILGTNGNRILRLENIAQVHVITPNRGKIPNFIISGQMLNVMIFKIWLKMLLLCHLDVCLLTHTEFWLVLDLLKNAFRHPGKTIFGRIFNHNETFTMTTFAKKLWCCKSLPDKKIKLEQNTEKCRICKKFWFRFAYALGNCDHLICCENCIIEAFKNPELRCEICHTKIETFEMIDRSFMIWK